jgi:MinD superfamily P-loop ATPase
MIIAVASGKGGTGKTTFAVNLATALAQRGETVRLLDCDVEEPNDHLFVRPTFTEDRPVTALKPVLDTDKCSGCGACAEACNYNALAVVNGKVLVFNELCHSCGACSFVCPEDALSEHEAEIGRVQVAAEHDPFFFAHGLLGIGEALAPAVVHSVREEADPEAVTIVDAAPGTACAVVAAVSGADVALLVTEPTPFGLNDLKLAVGLTLKLGVPTGIIVNRSDGQDTLIAEYAESVGLPVAGRIPFRRDYAEAYSDGDILVDRFPELRENLLGIFDSMRTALPPTPRDESDDRPRTDLPPLSHGRATGYREITVISGKGGTGKTTVVSSLAQLAEQSVLADNDVDAADLHLLLGPTVREIHDFFGGVKAEIDPNECVTCGLCADACHFDAIASEGNPEAGGDVTFRVDPLACEGCGLCTRVCPAGAISGNRHVTGRWFVSSTEYGPMAHARLGIAEENSGRLVTQVRNRAAELAESLRLERILGDGPPGTGCPVIASVSGADLVVIVTEPTVSGVHDLERVLELTAHFRVPAAVVINKADLNTRQAARIEAIAERSGAQLLGHIPFDRAVNDALMAGRTVIDHQGGTSAAAAAVRDIWQRLRLMQAQGT